MKSTQISFSSGEISPEMQGRIDVRQYQFGLATCRNFIVRPQGVLDRRVGLRYAGAAFSDTYTSRLIPFKFSDTEAYAIELSHQRGRIWNNGNLVTYATPKGGSVESADTTADTLTFVERHGLAQDDVIQLIGTEMLGLGKGTNYKVNVVDSRTISLKEPAATLRKLFRGRFQARCACFLESELPDDYRGGERTLVSPPNATTLQVDNHYLSVGDVIEFKTSSTLNARGFYTPQDYFVVEVVSSSQFKVSDVRNGEAITASGDTAGEVFHRRYLEGDTVFLDGDAGPTTHGIYRATADVTATSATAVTDGTWELLPEDGTYTFDLPYNATELARLTFTQSNDVLTLAHPDHAPLEIIRYGLAHWATRSVTFEPNLATPTLGTPAVDRGRKFK